MANKQTIDPLRRSIKLMKPSKTDKEEKRKDKFLILGIKKASSLEIPWTLKV